MRQVELDWSGDVASIERLEVYRKRADNFLGYLAVNSNCIGPSHNPRDPRGMFRLICVYMCVCVEDVMWLVCFETSKKA